MESVCCFEVSIFTYKNASSDVTTDNVVDLQSHEKPQISNLRVRQEKQLNILNDLMDCAIS